MGSNHKTPQRTSTEAALAGALALLVEACEAGLPDLRRATVEALFAGAGLASRGIGPASGQAPDASDPCLNADGPALWRTIQRQRTAMADADAAR